MTNSKYTTKGKKKNVHVREKQSKPMWQRYWEALCERIDNIFFKHKSIGAYQHYIFKIVMYQLNIVLELLKCMTLQKRM